MELSPIYAASVIDEFFEAVQDLNVDWPTLQDYIFWWVMHLNGVRITGGDYTNYLLAVLIIQHAYVEDPSRLDYYPDPEDPKADSELKIAAGLIRRRARVDPARLADDTVDLARVASA